MPVYCDVHRLTNAQVYLDDCADVFVALAQNTSMTGQDVIVGEFVPARVDRLVNRPLTIYQTLDSKPA